MLDSSVADQMTRLKLKLLEKKLEAERENMEDGLEPSLPVPRSYDAEDAVLQSALRRRKDLLHKLQEQHLLEELSDPYSWGGNPRRSYRAEVPPVQIYPPFPAGPQPEQPRIIQQTVREALLSSDSDSSAGRCRETMVTPLPPQKDWGRGLGVAKQFVVTGGGVSGDLNG
uniref:Uncharacterized protein n=1 Tax=Vombatus ursinus TaxID=29139 RepID=A0A4X2MAM6_VOMUR